MCLIYILKGTSSPPKEAFKSTQVTSKLVKSLLVLLIPTQQCVTRKVVIFLILGNTWYLASLHMYQKNLPFKLSHLKVVRIRYTCSYSSSQQCVASGPWAFAGNSHAVLTQTQRALHTSTQNTMCTVCNTQGHFPCSSDLCLCAIL